MGDPQAGDRINNYLLEELVGSGSFGQVWRARHHMFDQLVAVKVPTDLQYVRNLQREGVAVHGLKHANIVRALDLDPYDDPPYLIMEYVDGLSLRQVLEAHPEGLPAAAAAEIMRGILSALSAAHQAGLIHRDVKPANILLQLGADGAERIAEVTRQAVKVTDFGLGHVGGITTASIMQSGSLLTEAGKSLSGTLAYMSPEQKEGQVDARSDLYSCGIVLFEMLTGERPSGVEVPSALRSDVPDYLDQVFKGSYTRLDRRYRSAADMLQALTPAGRSPPPLPSTGTVQACPHCNGAVQPADQFCIHCGRQLAAVVPRCPSCHAFVNGRDRYCIFCGTKLQADAVQ